MSSRNRPYYLKMDFSEYKIKLNIASAKLFERITSKSFYDMVDEDIFILAYCCLVVNNDFFISYDTFIGMLKNRKIAMWVEKEMERMGEFLKDLVKMEDNQAEGEDGKNAENPKISDLSADLVVSYGMNPHYVDYEMPIYELDIYFKAAERRYHAELEEKRLFSYLDNMANFKKKMKLAEYLPFPWETESKKKKAENDIRFNREAILNTFKKMNEDGKRGNDNNLGREVVQESGGGSEQTAECGEDVGGKECLAQGNDSDSQSGKVEPCGEA